MYIKDLRDVVISTQPSSIDSANGLKLISELELLLSQRRIRSIYQANTEIQHAFPPLGPSSPQEYSQQPFSDDVWHEFMAAQFEFEEPSSLNFLDSSWLTQQYQTAVAATAEAASEVSIPELPSDIKAVVDSMPSCSFCRDQHIRCDRELPCCGACRRSPRECTYYDIALSQEVPRRLVTRSLLLVDTQTESSLECFTILETSMI